jgi:hypothetical protein
MDLIAQSQVSPIVRVEMLGETLDGHDMDLLILGDEAPEKKKVWMIARQHPGESMAEWFVQGALGRLLDRYVASALCCGGETRRGTFQFLVPMSVLSFSAFLMSFPNHLCPIPAL